MEQKHAKATMEASILLGSIWEILQWTTGVTNAGDVVP